MESQETTKILKRKRGRPSLSPEEKKRRISATAAAKQSRANNEKKVKPPQSATTKRQTKLCSSRRQQKRGKQIVNLKNNNNDNSSDDTTDDDDDNDYGKRQWVFESLKISPHEYKNKIRFDKLPPAALTKRQDDYQCILDAYCRDSCLKNIVCTITTNLDINVDLFTWRFGGVLTNSLAGNRCTLMINNHRYVILCFSTGKILLTNMFFLNRIKEYLDFFVNFILLLIKRGVATIRSGSGRKLRIRFLIENFQYSFSINEHIFRRIYLPKTFAAVKQKISSFMYEQGPRESLVTLSNYIKDMLICDGYIVHNIIAIDMNVGDKPIKFPADLIQIEIARDGRELLNFKSAASLSRHHHNFDKQKVSITLFENGKIIVTGMQTLSDGLPFFKILTCIVEFFYQY